MYVCMYVCNMKIQQQYDDDTLYKDTQHLESEKYNLQAVNNNTVLRQRNVRQW